MIRSAAAAPLPNASAAEAARQAAAGGLIAEHLLAGRSVRLTITTTSMWPALLPGDEVTVRPLAPGAARPGDIVVRQSGRAWLAHRLLTVQGAGGAARPVTKGDNCPLPDEASSGNAPPYGAVVAVQCKGHEARLDSPPARRWAALLAGLSRLHAALGRARLGLAARAAGWVLRGAAGAARRAAGL